ncbi:hypothetical protein [Eikenella longinqua]|nr:hypothetical protein [Eikenella longinqua]
MNKRLPENELREFLRSSFSGSLYPLTGGDGWPAENKYDKRLPEN